MPTVYYIYGCPFADECSAQKTSSVKRNKNMSFYGKTAVEAQDKCCNHLTLSSLHNKSKRMAWEATRYQEVFTYEADTDDDEPMDVVEQTPTTTSPETSDKCPHCGNHADALLTDLSLVEGSAAASSSNSRSLRAVKGHIADAEQAARKAQEIAMNAALAFGDVASELSQAYRRVDGADDYQ